MGRVRQVASVLRSASRATKLLAAAVAISVLSAPAQPPEETKPPATSEADRLLLEARSAAEAGLKWLQLRARRTQHAAESAATEAESAWETAVAEARASGAATVRFGVSLYPPSPSPSPPPSVPPTAVPAPWQPLEGVPATTALPSRLVLLVHGLDEPGSIWAELAPALRSAELSVARFDYPDDQHIAASAALLGQSLQTLKSRGVSTVDLVCHSMGGLVARDVLTSPDWYAGDGAGNARLPAVGRIFLIGTPNKGSPMAGLRVLAEVREQFVRWVDSDGRDPAALLGFLSDGTGEAGDDLRPDSPYLAELNARPAPRVGITVIVGQLVAGEATDLAGLAGSPLARELLGEKGIAELTAGAAVAAGRLGDGVVARESAILDGVADTVFVTANHRSLLNRWGLVRRMGSDTTAQQATEPAPAIPIILDRLTKPPTNPPLPPALPRAR